MEGAAGTSRITTMKYSIVMLTCNRPHLLRDSLHSVIQYRPPDSEIIVVDNATPEIHLPPDVIHIRLNRNYGVWARNFAFEAARGDFIIQIDDDVVVTAPDWIAKMESFITLGVIAVGQQGCYKDLSWGSMGMDPAAVGDYCDILTGFIWMFRNKGYHYDNYWRDHATFWHEESEMQFQMKADGWRMRRCSTVAQHRCARNQKEMNWEMHNAALEYVKQKWQHQADKLRFERAVK